MGTPTSFRTALFLFVTLGLYILSQAAAARIGATTPTTMDDQIMVVAYKAKRGDIVAQSLLGRLYIAGAGSLPKDTGQGLYWLRVAASQGSATSQETIGEIFHYGIGIVRDFERAAYWYRQAAENGRPSAQEYLGLFYSGGLGGIKHDCGMALNWYGRALAGGYSSVERNIIWILATCPEAEHRDGEKALTMALNILTRKTSPEPGDFDNLAAAYAEVGRFDKAIASQQQAIAMLHTNAEGTRRERFVARLELYLQGKRWRGTSNAQAELYGQ